MEHFNLLRKEMYPEKNPPHIGVYLISAFFAVPAGIVAAIEYYYNNMEKTPQEQYSEALKFQLVQTSGSVGLACALGVFVTTSTILGDIAKNDLGMYNE